LSQSYSGADVSPAKKPADLRDPEAHMPLTNLAFHILLALADPARHGYAIIQDIERRTGGAMQLRSGTLYTAIQRLESDGLLVEDGRRPAADRDDERRRYYRLTPLGRNVAALEAARLASMLSTAAEKGLLRS
jgi:DNA-binding PadR family transcriptional regulator